MSDNKKEQEIKAYEATLAKVTQGLADRKEHENYQKFRKELQEYKEPRDLQNFVEDIEPGKLASKRINAGIDLCFIAKQKPEFAKEIIEHLERMAYSYGEAETVGEITLAEIAKTSSDFEIVNKIRDLLAPTERYSEIDTRMQSLWPDKYTPYSSRHSPAASSSTTASTLVGEQATTSIGQLLGASLSQTIHAQSPTLQAPNLTIDTTETRSLHSGGPGK